MQRYLTIVHDLVCLDVLRCLLGIFFFFGHWNDAFKIESVFVCRKIFEL